MSDSKWQDVKTAPLYERVLFFGKHPTDGGVAVFEGVKIRTDQICDPVYDEWYTEATHWMPLPDGPE